MPELVIPGITDPAKLATIARSRKLSQYIRSVENALSGICPFCVIDQAYNKIAMENSSWYVWPCNPPEANTRMHFLFVPKRHVTYTGELTDREVLDLFGQSGIRQEVHKKFRYASCGMMVRDGNATLSAGTIEHLHFHDMVPDGTGRVESPFYKGAASENEGVARAIVFEKLRTGMQYSGLTHEEWELVKGRL